MNEDILESIKNLHQEVTELRNEQNDFRISITKYVTSTSRDTEWMREKLNDINNKFDKCGFCKNPDESTIIKKSIQELKDDQNRVKYTVYGGTAVLSIIVTVVTWFILNKDKIFP